MVTVIKSGSSGDQVREEQTRENQIRLLPGILIVILQWIIRFLIPVIFPGAGTFSVLGGLAGGLAIIIWWVFFSHAKGFDRWGAIVLIIGSFLLMSPLAHISVRTGMQGMMFAIYTVPVFSLAFVIWAVATRNLPVMPRRVIMAVTILLSFAVWTLMRCDGITGEGGANFSFRWTETSEEKLLGMARDEMTSQTEASGTGTQYDWSGFRGTNRDGVVHNVRINTDWRANPPEELWRLPVGPGCSSFAVRGAHFYTQEQRGNKEVVACYNLADGSLVWKHTDSARFYDSHAGAGPRSTPTLSGNRIYAIGATGILNVLNPEDGSVLWSRNTSSDIETEIPTWGYTSSPVVTGDVVLIALAGTMIAYDIESGDLRWKSPDGGSGYSSPHLMTIEGVPQVLFMSESGAASYVPSTGEKLWELPWPQVDRILQPSMTENGDILLPTGADEGIRRVTVSKVSGSWSLEERWTSTHLKSFFNDFVVHKGHAYGFTGPSLACIELEGGKRKWRGGRFGGQMLVLAEQDLLLVLTEKGELALVEAKPERLRELTRIPAIEGKTWNHPVLVGNLLLVRNTEEMAAFRLQSL